MALGRREMARGAINRNPQERASIHFGQLRDKKEWKSGKAGTAVCGWEFH